jgi:hypothetical protein
VSCICSCSSFGIMQHFIKRGKNQSGGGCKWLVVVVQLGSVFNGPNVLLMLLM